MQDVYEVSFIMETSVAQMINLKVHTIEGDGLKNIIERRIQPNAAWIALLKCECLPNQQTNSY